MNHVTETHFQKLLDGAAQNDRRCFGALMLRYGYHIQRRQERLQRQADSSRRVQVAAEIPAALRARTGVLSDVGVV